jgi:hypothetical protein
LAIAKKNLGCAVRERKCISGLFIYLSPPMPKRVDKDIGRVSANPIGCCFFHHIFPNFIENSYLA